MAARAAGADGATRSLVFFPPRVPVARVRTEFWDTVCPAMPLVRAIIVVELILGVLLLFSVPALSPGEPTYYVAGFAGVIVLVSLGLFTYVYRKCGQWREAKGIDRPEARDR